jgi:hypothetical protein
VYNKLADWGVDFVKVDDLVHYPKEIIAIGKAVQASGRTMVYSLSPGGSANLKDLHYYKSANMVRITSDIWDKQSSIDNSFNAMRIWQGRGYKGFWPDLDMIPFGQLELTKPIEYEQQRDATWYIDSGRYKRYSQFTKAQMRTFITQRALFSSPLFVGGDLPTIDDYSLELLTNPDMLACNQNGYPATLILEDNGIEMWGTTVPATQVKGWIGIFNRTGTSRKVRLTKTKLGLVTFYNSNREGMQRDIPNDFHIKDIWSKSEYVLDDDVLEILIEKDDVFFIYYWEI